MHGIEITTSVDFEEFKRVRAQLRNDPISPYFDPSHNGPELSRSAFWIHASKDGQTVYVEAYRLYEPVGPFVHWCRAWLMDAHTRAGEDVHISSTADPDASAVAALGGRMVYRGELFMKRELRCGTADSLIIDMSLLHYALVWLYWRPDYIWGLSTERFAQRGMLARINFTDFERDFIVWQRRPACVNEDSETLASHPRQRIIKDLLTFVNVGQGGQASAGTS